MNSSNLLTGIGLFVCVGGIVLIALLAWAAWTLTKGRTNQSNIESWNNRGSEQPRYNGPNSESQGGFDNIPNTGSSYPPPGGIIGSSGFGGAQTYNPDESSGQSRNQPDDSDEISSSDV